MFHDLLPLLTHFYVFLSTGPTRPTDLEFAKSLKIGSHSFQINNRGGGLFSSWWPNFIQSQTLFWNKFLSGTRFLLNEKSIFNGFGLFFFQNCLNFGKTSLQELFSFQKKIHFSCHWLIFSKINRCLVWQRSPMSGRIIFQGLSCQKRVFWRCPQNWNKSFFETFFQSESLFSVIF